MKNILIRGGEGLVGVQYLRGWAALLVVLLHATQMAGMTKYFGYNPFGQIFSDGFIGVDIFFVISGFIIVYTSIDFSSGQTKLSFRQYMRRRLVRVVPFMWIVTLIYALLKYAALGSLNIPLVLQSLFLIPGVDVQPNVLWTLRHELIFYLLFSCVFLGGALALIPLFLWLSLPVVFSILGFNAPIDGRELLYPLLGSANVLFLFGMLVAYLYSRFGLNSVPRLMLSTKWPLVFVFICVYSGSKFFDYSRDSLPPVLLMGVACSILLFVAVCYSPQTPGGMFDRVFRLLGDCSYSIYLTHPMFLSFSLRVTSSYFSEYGVNIGVAFCVVLSLVMGVFVSLYVEKPLIKFIGRLFDRRSLSGVVGV